MLIFGCGRPQGDETTSSNDAAKTAPKSAAENDGFIGTIDANALADHPPWRSFAPGIDTVEVSLGVPPNTPGNSDRLIIYVPHGQHQLPLLGLRVRRSRRATIFAGNSQADADRAEHVPYAKAGYAVVAFDIDGTFNENDTSAANVQATYARFKAAGGGVVNGKNALEYVLARLPEVNPERLYVAGHSSAAIWALLFAEHEPRIKGCIAYAPLPDLFGRDPSKRAGLEAGLPGIAQLSPQESVQLLKCPVFVFHAENDHNIPIGITRRFVALLKQTNPGVTFHTVPTGDHYRSMIKEGIPQGIQWLKSLPAEATAKPTLPVAG